METKDMNTEKKISQILEDFFEKENMVFYRRDVDENITTFILPYEITKQNINFDIRLDSFADKRLCRMCFDRELNTEHDYSGELLDMNSDLSTGKISVEKNSNKVTYTVYFEVKDEQSVKAEYRKGLDLCLLVLARLFSSDIIKK